MKIITHGKPKEELYPARRFECSRCGCVFEAEYEEYGTVIQFFKTYYICECPECSCQAQEQTYQRNE